MKELEGKYVYLRPTANHARKGKKVKKALIIKVAKVFVTLTIEGLNLAQKYRFDGNRLSNEHNAGYVVYANQQDLDEYYEANELADRINRKYRYQRDFAQVEINKLRQVAEILDI